MFSGATDSGNYYMMHQEYDPMGQLAWLEEQLKSAEHKKNDVLLAKHIPIGSGSMSRAFERHFLVLAERYENVIRGIFTAHSHADHMKFIRRSPEMPISFMEFITPSLTTRGKINPSFRLWHFDDETNAILDYDQYSMDISNRAALNDPKIVPQWVKTYSFLAEYGLTDFSSFSQWEALYQKFKKRDKAVLMKYINHYHAIPMGYSDSTATSMVCD